MKNRKNVEWTKLDNAAKIFPPTSNERDTKVFRFAVELYDQVNPDILQEALDETIDIFPLYKSVLRRGVFWYYFETSNIRPLVEEESKPVCARIYYENRKNLLFRVIYYKNRISVETFHALSDGTGALLFLKTLLYQYLIRRYKNDFSEKLPKMEQLASVSQKMDDSFKKYYSGKPLSPVKLNKKAFHIKGTRRDESRMTLIEGTMSVKAVLKVAHEYNTTMTVYLTALFMEAIHKNMSVRGLKLPVVFSIPVNLRNYFQSESARNFFSTIQISYNFSTGDNNFDSLIGFIQESFKHELTEEKLREQIERLTAFEHNMFARAIPLLIKDYTLKGINYMMDRGITAALSNIGKVSMPEEFGPYIKLFDVFTSARRPQICMCSYGDNLTISFTSPYIDTDIQKDFFKALSDKGIDVKISTNF